MVRTPNSPAWDSGSTLGQRTKTHIPHSVPPKFEKLKKKQKVTAIGGKEKSRTSIINLKIQIL